jgi:hypothetical protein
MSSKRQLVEAIEHLILEKDKLKNEIQEKVDESLLLESILHETQEVLDNNEKLDNGKGNAGSW